MNLSLKSQVQHVKDQVSDFVSAYPYLETETVWRHLYMLLKVNSGFDVFSVSSIRREDNRSEDLLEVVVSHSYFEDFKAILESFLAVTFPQNSENLTPVYH